MAGVAMDEAGHHRGSEATADRGCRHFRHRKGQYDTSTGSHPEKVLTGQQGRDAQTCCLVLAYYVISSYKDNTSFVINIGSFNNSDVLKAEQ